MIKEVLIENFYGFKRFEQKDAARINLVIGKNDSGKTGLLKLLYATAQALVDKQNSVKEIKIKSAIGLKLNNTFFPRKGGIGSLVSKGFSKEDRDRMKVELVFTGNLNTSRLSYMFAEGASKEPSECTEDFTPFSDQFNTVFIPAKEVLTAFNAITLSREKYFYEDFDDTYYDLVKSLRLPTSKGRVAQSLSKVSGDLEEIFEGQIEQSLSDANNPFLFKKGNRIFTMPLTAEGIKKIGILTTLIRNREIGKHTLLFFDEPETALHPAAQRKFAEMMFRMLNIEGLQIYMATHSYFIINQFANIAAREKVKIDCIALDKEKGEAKVGVNISDLQEGLPKNGIISEAQEMFREDMKIELGL